jgi:ribonuclease-3
MDSLQLTKLQSRLGYTFKDVSLLKAALTHSSYANENKKNGAVSNERLEFLGDSLLGMAVADLIYRGESAMPEGQMTRFRSEIVCERSLAGLASSLKIGDCLILGHGEEKSGGRERPSILADAIEAVLAAVYLDSGFESVSKLVAEHLMPRPGRTHPSNFDYKTALQEVVQEKAGQVLSYITIGESGPDHAKTFTVEVRLNEKRIGQGSGKSKKEAEQSAAQAALDSLRPES